MSGLASRSIRLTLVNRKGLHARAAAQFVQRVEGADAAVTVSKDGHRVDGRSIMGLLMLGAARGSAITIEASGPDAERVLTALAHLVGEGFGEPE